MNIRTLAVATAVTLGIIPALNAITHTNLFDPYDILLFKPIAPNRWFDLSIAYEGSLKTKGFETDPEDRVESLTNINSNEFSRRVNPLQIWQQDQNFGLALSGSELGSSEAFESFLFNLKSERLDRLTVTGDIRVPVNLMGALRFALPCNFILGFYLPYYEMTIDNINWCETSSSDATSYEAEIDQFLARIEGLGHLNLRDGFTQKGVGDFASVLWWYQNFNQAKQWLRNVYVSLRGGLTFPTGKHAELDRVLSLPLGHGGGVGLLFGGTLELTYGECFQLGIDGEFLNLFGSRKERRIKTAMGQGDITFLQRSRTQFDPGFWQHYTLYITLSDLLIPGLATTLAYQHTRQHEGTLILDNPAFSTTIANTAEGLQDWTTHSIIALMSYEYQYSNLWCPSISAWFKTGFNGKRAILFDTAGFQLTFAF